MKNILIICLLTNSLILSARTYTLNIYVDMNTPDGSTIYSQLSNEISATINSLNVLKDGLKTRHRYKLGKLVQVNTLTGYGVDDELYLASTHSFFSSINNGKYELDIFINPYFDKPMYISTENYITIYKDDKSSTPVYLHEIAHNIVYEHKVHDLVHIKNDNKYFGCTLIHENHCRNLMCHKVHSIWAGVPLTFSQQSFAIKKRRKESMQCSNSYDLPVDVIDTLDQSLDNCDPVQSYKIYPDEHITTDPVTLKNIQTVRKILRENDIIPYQERDIGSKRTLEILKQKFNGEIPPNYIGNEDDYLKSLIYGARVVEKKAYIEGPEFKKLLNQEAHYLNQGNKLGKQQYINRRMRDIKTGIEDDYQKFLNFYKR